MSCACFGKMSKTSTQIRLGQATSRLAELKKEELELRLLIKALKTIRSKETDTQERRVAKIVESPDGFKPSTKDIAPISPPVLKTSVDCAQCSRLLLGMKGGHKHTCSSAVKKVLITKEKAMTISPPRTPTATTSGDCTQCKKATSW